MSANLRRSKRQPFDYDGMLYRTDGEPLIGCRLRNVSTGGAQIELAQETELPRNFLLALSRDGHVRRRCTQVWNFSTVVGVRFEQDQSTH